MNCSFAIDKLTLWKSNGWTKIDQSSSQAYLRIYYDQLIITVNDRIVETFNLNSKIKGVFKGDVLILIASAKMKEVKKLKFQIISNVGQCLNALGQCFTVINHDSKKSITTKLRYRNLEDIIKNVLETDTSGLLNIQLPQNYNNFVKLCLLDPTFSELVQETQNVINSIIIKK